MQKPSQQEITEMLREYALTRDESLRNRLVEAHLYIASIVAGRVARRGGVFVRPVSGGLSGTYQGG